MTLPWLAVPAFVWMTNVSAVSGEERWRERGAGDGLFAVTEVGTAVLPVTIVAGFGHPSATTLAVPIIPTSPHSQSQMTSFHSQSQLH